MSLLPVTRLTIHLVSLHRIYILSLALNVLPTILRVQQAAGARYLDGRQLPATVRWYR